MSPTHSTSKHQLVEVDDNDDEAPPPLPEKSTHSDSTSDYANVAGRSSSESEDRPQLTRRVTHRDRVRKQNVQFGVGFFSIG